MKVALSAILILIVCTMLLAVRSQATADPIQCGELYVKDGDTIVKGHGTVQYRRNEEYRLVGFDATSHKIGAYNESLCIRAFPHCLLVDGVSTGST